MLVKIISNGVEVEAEISEQDLKKLFPDPAPKKKTGWEEVNECEVQFYIDEYGKVNSDVRSALDIPAHTVDEARDKVSNNFNSEELAENIARAEALHRNMLRRSIELCDKINWDNMTTKKYFIDGRYYTTNDETKVQLKISFTFNYRSLNQIYFDTYEHAKQVMEEFEDELLWYHTEFKERMD